MAKEKVLNYSNEEITVVWKPDLCIHAAECVKGLPEVFKPKDRPWVQIGETGTDKLVDTINKCPSGALSYKLKEVDSKIDSPGEALFRVKVSKNGPFLISGNIEIEDSEGNLQTSKGNTTALCRCGASGNKPFCDGSHKKTGFEG